MAAESARAKALRLSSTTARGDWRAEGEETTGTALMALPPGWTVLDDLPWTGEDAGIDHVAVGPAGVFVIRTEARPDGPLGADHGALRRDGPDRRRPVRGVTSAAESLVRLVPSVRADYVHPVVCIAQGDLRSTWTDGVLVCSSSQLVRQLIAYEEVLPGGLARAVATDIGRRLGPPGEPGPGPQQRQRKRRPFAALVPAVLGAALAVTLATQPMNITSIVDDATDTVVELVGRDTAPDTP